MLYGDISGLGATLIFEPKSNVFIFVVHQGCTFGDSQSSSL